MTYFHQRLLLRNELEIVEGTMTNTFGQYEQKLKVNILKGKESKNAVSKTISGTAGYFM